MASTHELLLSMNREWLENEFRRSCLIMPRKLPLNSATVCRVLGRYPMEVMTNDIGCSTHLALDGFWEMWITMAIARNVPRGARCFDVGANVGYFSVLLAAVMGCRVDAFEPQQDLCELLHRTASMNGMSSFELHHSALGNENSCSVLYHDTDTANASLLMLDEEVHDTESVVVCLADEIFSGEVDFIKIDVEGWEPEVISGMNGIIESSPNLQICLEWTPGKYDNECEFLDSMLSRFEMFEIGSEGNLIAATEEFKKRLMRLKNDEFEMVWFRRRKA